MAKKYPDVSEMNYLTNRRLENKKGERTGKIFMWRRKGEEDFNIELKCPECGNYEEKKEKFARRPYNPSCSKCGTSFMITKLKQKKKK